MGEPGAGRRPALKLLLINAVALAVILAAAEILLARLEPPSRVRYSVYPPNQSTIVTVDPEVTPGVEGDAGFTINAVGTRGPMPSADDGVRIIALGGSTTECFVMSLEESWPHRLGRILEESTRRKVWVGNIAKAGRASRQHYFDAKYVVPQFGGVDLAILLVGVNDLFNRMVQGREFEPADVEALDDAGDYISTVLNLSDPEGSWFGRLRLVGRARRLMEDLAWTDPEQREVRRLLSHTLPDYYRNCRAMRRNRGETLETLPPMEAALDEFARNMRLIIALLRSNGTEPVLVSQPALWRPDLGERERDLLWLGSADGWPPNREAGPYYSVEAMAKMLAQYNNALREVARAESVLFIDLAAVIPGDLTTLYDDIHFNENGSARVAEAIAGILLESGFPGDLEEK